MVEPSWAECCEDVGTRLCRRYQRLGYAVWYQVRLGCQEFIDSGFVMSVVPRALNDAESCVGIGSELG